MKPTIKQLRELIQETLAETWDIKVGTVKNPQHRKDWLDTHMGREYSDITLREAAEALYKEWQPDPSDDRLAYEYKIQLGDILGIKD